MSFRATILLAAVLMSGPVAAGPVTLSPRMHHLRIEGPREWSHFPERAEAPRLDLRFRARPNEKEAALRLRQQDVKQTWKVLLNGKEVGRLPRDENDQVVYLAVPPGGLREGENHLVLEQTGQVPDDVRVGEITLEDRPVSALLSEATVEVTVTEQAGKDARAPVPCRITVLDSQGALMTVAATSGAGLAVRPGVVYTRDGRARFGLPRGEYTIHAGRGFEYGIASARVSLAPGDLARPALALRREVPTPGYVSCDTHVHTLTLSGHGDATLAERVVAIAGEGIELPVATEHNRQCSYHEAAVEQEVRRHFTPVPGNEVTTRTGHFNIFPVPPDGPTPDHRLENWDDLARNIRSTTGAPVVILNHARDLHSGFRPFGPARHLALTGESLDGRRLPANAMEVVNSGAQQSDVLRLPHDWLGLLNRGILLTPVGASDSHDVSRHFVGQGRTYIRCPDDAPDRIDVARAVASLREGRVLVSCGLLADITVDEKHGPGDLVSVSGEVKVRVRVLGPAWATADRVVLYANGIPAREARIEEGKGAGVKWQGDWTLPRPRQDCHLVAIATGPGVRALTWPTARPYQPTSPVVRSRVLGLTGAVWLDADGDGERTSPLETARRLEKAAGGSVSGLIESLAPHDEAVAAQAASLLRARGVALDDEAVRAAAHRAGTHVERALEAYREAWRQSQIAQAEKK